MKCPRSSVSPSHRPLRRLAADGFNVVPVGIEHEGALAVGVILRTKCWRSIVAAAGGSFQMPRLKKTPDLPLSGIRDQHDRMLDEAARANLSEPDAAHLLFRFVSRRYEPCSNGHLCAVILAHTARRSSCQSARMALCHRAAGSSR